MPVACGVIALIHRVPQSLYYVTLRGALDINHV
jgi:hypothetical protein